jgi:hypothetical protein
MIMSTTVLGTVRASCQLSHSGPKSMFVPHSKQCVKTHRVCLARKSSNTFRQEPALVAILSHHYLQSPFLSRSLRDNCKKPVSSRMTHHQLNNCGSLRARPIDCATKPHLSAASLILNRVGKRRIGTSKRVLFRRLTFVLSLYRRHDRPFCRYAQATDEGYEVMHVAE